MSYQLSIRGRRYHFDSMKQLLAKASSPKSGDEAAGVGANSQEERVIARMVLAEQPLSVFLEEPALPYESDDVTRIILDNLDQGALASISHLSIGEFREWLLSPKTRDADIQAISPGLTPEMVAAVSKVMKAQDLVMVASRLHPTAAFRSTIGIAGTLASRLQPNHPTDDPLAIVLSIFDGLIQGSGDAVIGINPAGEDLGSTIGLFRMVDELITRYEIPTQSSILAHITLQLKAAHAGAPIDLFFSSIGGTEQTNASFGVTISMLEEAQSAAWELNRGTIGDNAMYFETGQGTALSAGADFGVDQQTVEARAYGLARVFKPLLVNSVVGFIGPEYLANSKQIIRAGLEDHFCAKLLGIPMGMDVCMTSHADADQDDLDILLHLLANAGVAFVIAVPGGDDVMLHYQSLSFQDVNVVRRMHHLKPSPEFEAWYGRRPALLLPTLSYGADFTLGVGGI